MAQTFFSIARVTLRIMVRQRMFWVIQALQACLIAISLPGMLDSAMFNLSLSFVYLNSMLLVLSEWLLLPLLVASTLNRHRGPVSELLWSTPLDAIAHWAGVLAGIWVAALLGLVFQIALRFAILIPITGSVLVLVWIQAGLVLVAIMTAVVSLLAVCAVLVRRSILVLMIWLLSVVLVLKWLPPSLFFFRPSLGWGQAAAINRGVALLACGVGIGAGALAVGLELAVDRRQSSSRRLLLVPCLLVALLVGSSSYRNFRPLQVAALEPTSPADIQLDRWHVLGYTLNVQLDSAAGQLSGQATLALKSSGPAPETIVLRLNPGLQLDSVVDPQGVAARFEPAGDSWRIIPALPMTEPFTVMVRWHGALHPLPHDYLAFDPTWPSRGLLTDEAGYLLRDGDWYPWPWSTQPHLAPATAVTLQSDHPRLLATAPLDRGVASWRGALPSILAVIPPSAQVAVGDTQVSFGRWTDQAMVEHLKVFAAETPRVWAALGDIQAPRQLVVLPGLADFIWSGDLLLIPEDSRSNYDWVGRSLQPGMSAAVERRAVLTGLARSWMSGYLELPGMFELNNRQQWLETYLLGNQLQYQGNAWGSASWEIGPRSYSQLLALWIGIELADPGTQAEDLALQQFDMLHNFMAKENRLLPMGVFGSTDQGALIVALHEWAAAYGPERALRLVGTLLHEGQPFDPHQHLAALEARSSLAVCDRWKPTENANLALCQ